MKEEPFFFFSFSDLADQKTLASIDDAGMTGVGGITITTIIALAVVLAGALICYAQTKKVPCFMSGNLVS